MANQLVNKNIFSLLQSKIILGFISIFIGMLSFNVCHSVYSEMRKASNVSEVEKKKIEEWFTQIDLLDTEVNPVNLKTIASDLVIINFWASWCTPCLKEIPTLMTFMEKIKKNQSLMKSSELIAINGDQVNGINLVKILGNDGKEKANKVSKNITQNTLTGINKKLGLVFVAHHIADPEGSLQATLKVKYFPTTMIFDVKEKKLVYYSTQEIDFMNDEEINKIFQK